MNEKIGEIFGGVEKRIYLCKCNFVNHKHKDAPMKPLNRTILLLLSVLLSVGTWAQTLTEQEAAERAMQFLNQHHASSRAKVMGNAPSKPVLKAAKMEAEKIYAFNVEGGGYVIASGDERTLPVLGYSDSGSLDWERMPENMRAWLKQYDDAVATLGDRTDFVDGAVQGNTGMRKMPSERKPVEPLIKTHWSQYAPYWDQAPIYAGPRADLRGQRCKTGCVATAMAQILNYYQWPKTIPDGLPGYNMGDINPVYDYQIDALPPVAFDWDNMLNDYRAWNPETGEYDDVGTEQQRHAVATLMRYCGQAVKMMYGPDGLGSGALPIDLQQAYNDCLGYSAALYLDRYDYSFNEWEDIIYGEMAAGRPVLYSGNSEEIGHAFICDGYDGDGKFHINWGWEGDDDGYYTLSVLNPYTTHHTEMGFSIQQSAVIYIDPMMSKQPKPESSLTHIPELYQDMPMSVENRNVVVFFYLYGGEDAGEAVADYALGTQGEDGTWQPRFMGNPNDSIVLLSNMMRVEVDSTAFQSGDSLALYPLLRFRHAEAEWQVIQPLKSHVVIGRTDEGNFFITVHGGEYMIECVSGSITKGTGRLTERNNLTVVLKNNSEYDYQGMHYLTPRYYGYINPDDITRETPFTWGKEMKCNVYLRAGEETEVTFSFVPEQGGYTEFRLCASDGYGLSSFPMELTNDKLCNYNPYVENKSYFARKDGKWLYHVELCDIPGVEIPHWIPADNLCLKIRTFINEDQLEEVKIDEEIREYLMALPEKGGKGDYKIVYEMPINISGDGKYYMDSYLIGWLDDDKDIVSCKHEYTFQYGDLTAIEGITNADADGTWYTLSGQKLDGEPTESGIYIYEGKKVVIK